MDKKMYGLVLPKKKDSVKVKTKSIFDSDSDEGPAESVSKKDVPVKLSKIEAKHIEEDPSIYEYDSIYDSMKETQAKKQVIPVEARKPKFMSSLLKAADKRKKDQERRAEKKIHKERLKEGEEFQDKEAFVTSAYKKKMQEMEEEEEKEKMKERLDEMMDVTKQKDMSGFYRHLLNQTTGEEKVPEFGGTDKMFEKGSGLKSNSAANVDVKKEKKSHSDSSSEEESEVLLKKKESFDKNVSSSGTCHESAKNRIKLASSKDKMKESIGPISVTSTQQDSESDQISTRKRHDSGSSNEEHSQRKQLRKNENKMGGGCIDETLVRDKNISEKLSDDETRSPCEDTAVLPVSLSGSKDVDLDADDDDIVDSDSEKFVTKTDTEPKTGESVKKSDMSFKFMKRTVGEVFKQAQERYFKRLASRDTTKKV